MLAAAVSDSWRGQPDGQLHARAARAAGVDQQRALAVVLRRRAPSAARGRSSCRSVGVVERHGERAAAEARAAAGPAGSALVLSSVVAARAKSAVGRRRRRRVRRAGCRGAPLRPRAGDGLASSRRRTTAAAGSERRRAEPARWRRRSSPCTRTDRAVAATALSGVAKCSSTSACTSPMQKPSSAPTVIRIHSSCSNAGRISASNCSSSRSCILRDEQVADVHRLAGVVLEVGHRLGQPLHHLCGDRLLHLAGSGCCRRS